MASSHSVAMPVPITNIQVTTTRAPIGKPITAQHGEMNCPDSGFPAQFVLRHVVGPKRRRDLVYSLSFDPPHSALRQTIRVFCQSENPMTFIETTNTIRSKLSSKLIEKEAVSTGVS